MTALHGGPEAEGRGAAFAQEVANFMAFMSAEKTNDKSVFMAVMGMTGSGKSSYISAVTGRDDVKVGTDLSSCTNSVDIYKCVVDDYDVYLIDTPGFDDTNRSDLDILKTVSNFFSVAYANRKYLSGIIYLHRISDTRMTGTSKRNLDMFKALCGEGVYSNVAVLTSMWATDLQSEDFAKQVAREKQLREEYLPEVLSEGGQLLRLRSLSQTSLDRDSAKAVFRGLFNAWKEDEVTLNIQHELVNDVNATLDKTAAGQVLLAQYADATRFLSKELDRIRETIHSSSGADDAHVKALQEQRRGFEESLATIRQEQSSMKTSLIEMHKQERDRLVEEMRVLERRWQAELEEKENERRVREQVLRDMQQAAKLQQDELVAFQRRAEEQRRYSEQQQAQEQADQRSRAELEASYRQRMFAEGKWREDRYQEEIDRMRREMEHLRMDTEYRIQAANQAQDTWSGPMMQSLVSGGMGLAGNMITSGALCIVQ